MGRNSKDFQPPLHLAVIHEDIEAIKLLSHSPDAMLRRNGAGFTAVELARFLGRYEYLPLLQQDTIRTILVQPKGKECVEEYTIKQFEALFGVSYVETNVFFTIAFFEKVMCECPWMLASTVIGYEHRKLGIALKPYFEKGFVEDVSIRWINEKKGYGLFTERDFAPMTYIGEYVGIVRRISRMKRDFNEYCLHYPTRFFSYNFHVIDAEHAGNETRFVNHSDEPNLKVMSVIDRHLLRIAFFATKCIQKGEELTFDYGKAFWKKRQISP